MISKLLAKVSVPVVLAAMSVAGQAADIKDRSVKMPIVNNIDHPQGVGAKKFAELVEQKSGGKIKVKLFPGGRWPPPCKVARSKPR